MKHEPLHGIRVLDLSRLLPGPFCTLLLADLGAEIIKVEEVSGGDYMRAFGPFIGKESAYFLALNTGKKSLALNLKHPRGREIFFKLATTADVIVESFRPGTVDRLGIAYETIQKLNPRIVYCAISGYGQDGPDRDRVGHDLNYVARAGILGLNGQPGGPPSILPVQIADLGSAMYSAVAILASLRVSERSGKGSYLDIGMLDSAMSWLVMAFAEFAAGERGERGQLPLTGKYPCYNIYRTKDGEFMSLAAMELKFWSAFCQAVGRNDLLESQYLINPEVFNELRNLFAGRTRDDWVKLLDGIECCCEPVQSLDEVLDDPQSRHRNLFARTNVGGEPVILLNNPLRMLGGGEPGAVPGLGEHTFGILRELGYHDTEISELNGSGVIKCRDI